jgi:hypothetical protein
MILESAQLLSTAHHVIDGPKDGLFKAAFKNHPCAVWVRETRGNYMWLFGLFTELLKEYTFRYDKKHSCERLVELLGTPPDKINSGDVNTPALAMPEEFKVIGDPVSSYRNYYVFGKTHLHSWKRREIPSFVNILKTSGFKTPMANFIESAFTFTVKFAADLKAALAINPDLDIQEFTKPYFGFPTSPIVVKITQKEKSEPTSIVSGKERGKGKAAKGQGKGKCTATTAKGAQCSKCAKDGEVFCSIHLKKTEGKKSEGKKAKAAPKKVQPKHTHGPDEDHVEGACDLCDTHGDAMNPERVETSFALGEQSEDDSQDSDYVLEEEEFED